MVCVDVDDNDDDEDEDDRMEQRTFNSRGGM